MEFLIALIIFGASVAVYKDAITNNIARPARWGIGSAFIFFIVIPLYLFKRKKLIGSALSESDDASSVQGGKNVSPLSVYVLMFIFAFIAPVINFYKGDLPGCDSSDVHSVLTELLNGEKFSEPAQMSYDRVNAVRHCNLTVSDRVFSYTVKWYSEEKDQFVVQFEN